jgi:TRAP transporter TAXI family solute receptor
VASTRPAVLTRRAVLQALAAASVVAALPACSTRFAETRLTVATGGTQGVYFALGTALARVWQDRLGTSTVPEVLATAGSVQNLSLLASGAADVVFSQVDTAADHMAGTAADDPQAPRALARIYDDVVHVVVRASSRVVRLADLRGARVSVGAPDSGVYVIARRLLAAAGLEPGRDLLPQQLGINDSVVAMRDGSIDAFFWSGGLPTVGVTELAATTPIRLLDLDDVLAAVRGRHPVYAPGTVPAASYGISEPVTTMQVRNVLLVAATMPDDLAAELVDALFGAQQRLAEASAAALTIDPRSAIGTQPVPLHPGAEQFYRSAKNA